MKRKLVSFITLMVLMFCTTEVYGEYAITVFQFEGTVANSRVSGVFTLQNTGRVSGSYGYNKYTSRSSNAMIDLYGSWRSAGRNVYTLTLTEYAPNGKVSGTWNVTYNGKTGRLTGTMKNSKGRTYKVNCSGWSLNPYDD